MLRHLKFFCAVIVAFIFLTCACSTHKCETSVGEKDSGAVQTPQKGQKSCICIEIYAPVCGEDGRVYSNSCHAACENVKVKNKGECTK